MEHPKKFTIDRPTWARGQTPEGNYLYDADTEKMCCLGQVLNQCGFSKDSLKGIGSPQVFHDWMAGGRLAAEPLPGFPMFLIKFGTGSTEGTKTTYEAMRINDAKTLTSDGEGSDERREQLLTELFAGIGIEVDFAN